MISSSEQSSAQVSLSRVMAFMVITGLLLFFAIWAKPILVPLVFAVIFTLMLRPIANAVERFVPSRWQAIIVTFLAVALPVAAAILLFSYQTISVLDDLPTITEELEESLNRMFTAVSDRIGIDFELTGSEWVQERLSNALDEPFLYVSGLLAGGAGVVGALLLIFLYTFFLLLYRQTLYHFVLGQFSQASRGQMEEVFQDTQVMSYTYLKGLAMVMIILGILNSVGLLLIGIEFAFFWGFLAAFLAIVPYVGTFVGGLLPFMYALSTTDTTWQPIAVVALFLTVQTIEGNIITPKVVGSSIQINPLAAIIALFFGGFVWGVEGLILALPIVAILRIFLVHSTRFRPFGLLLTDNLAGREAEFLGQLDAPHYRIINFFRIAPRGVYDIQYEDSSTTLAEDTVSLSRPLSESSNEDPEEEGSDTERKSTITPV